MATNPSTLPENSGRITAPDSGYPFGSAQDDSTGTAGDGTPFQAALLNDIYGFQQALLDAAGIVPTGNPDTVLASQYRDALDVLYTRKTFAADISGAWEWQDNVKQIFGSDADVEIDYDSGGDTFDINLLGATDLRVLDGGTERLRYDSASNAFEFVSGKFRFNDDVALQFGGSANAQIDFDSGAQALDINLNSGFDVRFKSNSTVRLQYDNSGNRFDLLNSATLRFTDNLDLEFGTGKDAYFHYNSSADALDLHLLNLTDARLITGGGSTVRVSYTTSANRVTFEGTDLVMNNDLKLHFGTGSDVQVDYDSGADALEVRLDATADYKLMDNGTTVLQYDNSGNEFIFTAALRLSDDIPLRFGTGSDATVDYDSGADALEVRLDATADYKMLSNGVAKYDYDQSADEHTFDGDVLVNDQIRNTNDPVGNSDLSRKLYVDQRIADGTLFTGSVTAPSTATLGDPYTDFKQVIIKSLRGAKHSTMVIPTGVIVIAQEFNLATNGNENEGHALVIKFNSTTEVEVVDSNGSGNPLVQVIGAFRV